MKRSLTILLVTSLVITLITSTAWATRQKFTDFSVDIPTGYTAREVIEDDVRGNKYNHVVQIYSTSNSDAWMEIMLDTKVDTSGNAMTLLAVANVWAGRVGSTVEASDDTGLYYIATFNYKDDITGMGLVYDNTYNNKLASGKYCLEVKTDLISATTADNISNSIQFDTDPDPDPDPDDDDDEKLSGSGGGCVTGSSAFAMLGALIVFMKSRKR